MRKIIIAIDGYSACGKSTTAREVAKILGYRYIDSGAAEAILIGLEPDPAAAESSGNDAMAARKPVPGRLYGAHDDRRPAGAAAGF